MSIFLAMLVTAAAVTNVSTQLTADDQLAIQKILGVQTPPVRNSFDDELAKIRWAQARVFEVAPGMEPIPEFTDREPIDLLKVNSGLCYDRSRTMDKALAWMGFRTRHVFMVFAKADESKNAWTFVRQMLTHSNSHAVTEVMTSRGWLLVGSNTPWVSSTRDGQPMRAGQVYERRAEFANPPEYVHMPSWSIGGMYSRKGQFYRPFVPFPEFNWPDFLRWMVGD